MRQEQYCCHKECNCLVSLSHSLAVTDIKMPPISKSVTSSKTDQHNKCCCCAAAVAFAVVADNDKDKDDEIALYGPRNPAIKTTAVFNIFLSHRLVVADIKM